MSNATSDSEAAIAAEFSTDLIYNYCLFSALTVVAYEYVITLRHEYEFVWRRKWTGATWLFLANRYTLLAVCFIISVPFSASLPVLILTVFSALRAFALLGRAYAVAGLVFLLGVASVSLVLYQDANISHYFLDDPVLGAMCYYNFLISPSIVFNIICAIAADIVVIIITWIKTYRHVKEASSIGVNVSFSATLLQYGTAYFIVLSVVNLLSTLILLVPSLQLVSPVGNFLEVLPNIVVSRFLINLGEGNAGSPSDTANSSMFSVPNFHIPTLPSIVGNLGEPLTDGSEEMTEDEAYVDDEVRSVAKMDPPFAHHEQALGGPEKDGSEIEVVEDSV
ncbi:hypothetical protein NM688_g6776 [Phlebia brevispora]|uniref:Uncharacterized protein n=1 Tax=Phlebia brevispora TaxID=194682 RepID=A0ACC1SCU1_9APHY|nr:hypothetical protein NM688_g6776 [Phlebia brevispora]